MKTKRTIKIAMAIAATIIFTTPLLRAQGGLTPPGAPGETTVGGGHEAGGLLMTGEDEADLRGAKRFEQIEIFLTGNAEDIFDALVFEAADEKVGGFQNE